MKRKITILLAAAIIAAVAASGGCGKRGGSKKEKEAKPVVPVEVAAVSRGDIAAYFTGTATVEAEEETEVVAKVGGVVEELLVEEGQFVEAGAVLARLDDEQIAVQLAQARANLDRLRSIYERNTGLHEKNIVTTEVFQQSKYEYEQQKAAFELAELNLKYTAIRTPIGGIVAERLIKVGNMVLPNAPVFRVTGLNPLVAVLHVPEQQLSKLRVGLGSLLTIDALGLDELQGRVKRISPVVDPATGTVKVTVEARDPSHRVRPGMFARVKIIYDVHENVTTAPKDAIITEDRESSVFVIRDSIAVRQIVSIGYVNTAHVEILKGLTPGDTIVTTGKGSLKDSTKVHIIRE